MGFNLIKVSSLRQILRTKVLGGCQDFFVPVCFAISPVILTVGLCRTKVLGIEHGSNLRTFLMNGSMTSIILRSLSNWHNAFLVLNECTFPSLSAAPYISLYCSSEGVHVWCIPSCPSQDLRKLQYFSSMTLKRNPNTNGNGWVVSCKLREEVLS